MDLTDADAGRRTVVAAAAAAAAYWEKRIEPVCSIGCSFSCNRPGSVCLSVYHSGIKLIINPLLFVQLHPPLT